ncbi:MAG: hypothetical protein AAF292_08190, partial [Pseudomonadota bacterium]
QGTYNSTTKATPSARGTTPEPVMVTAGTAFNGLGARYSPPAQVRPDLVSANGRSARHFHDRDTGALWGESGKGWIDFSP